MPQTDRTRVPRASAATLRARATATGTPTPPKVVQIEFPAETAATLVAHKQARLLRARDALLGLVGDLSTFFPKVGATLPPTLAGLVRQPDGTPARRVRIVVQPPVYGDDDPQGADLEVAWPSPSATTDAKGRFRIALPPVLAPVGGLTLSVQGPGRVVELGFEARVIARGDLGVVDLPDVVLAFAEEEGLVERLVGHLPTSGQDVVDNLDELTSPSPSLRFGEGDCAKYFRANHATIDRFQYSLLFRLVEPDLGQRQIVSVQRLPEGNRVLPIRALRIGERVNDAELSARLERLAELGSFTFSDRVAIDRPIAVHDWHEQVMQDPTEVLKAGSLGIGYVLAMRQVWIPSGYSLGDLVYSLALAPREEQRIIVKERTQTLSVRDEESLQMSEEQRFTERASSSTSALFNSFVREHSEGESEIESSSNSWSIGGAAGVGGFLGGLLFGVGVGGGYASASTSTTTTSSQDQSRSFASSATEAFHSELSRRAQARRSAARVSVRMASASDRESVTTRIVANRNHCHSLTMQYWEVLRHFEVTTQPDDVELVCFVPLELIPFFVAQSGADDLALPDREDAFPREFLCARYGRLLQFLDTIEPWLPDRRDLQTAVDALRQLAGNPTITVEPKRGSEQQVIEVVMRGTFYAGESASITVVLRGNQRFGPFPFVPDGNLPTFPADSVEGLALGLLLGVRRNLDDAATLRAHIPIDAHRARNDIVRFELSRSGGDVPFESPDGPRIATAAELERITGAPRIYDLTANLLPSEGELLSAFPGAQTATTMPAELALPARILPPVLSFTDLLHIEALFQHVVRNTVHYSKIVWRSLTPDERVLLLEPFTIGVPGGSPDDPAEEIPLLDCVENRVLGFFGNSMVMPFFLPAQLAEEGRTTLDIQEALLGFHRQGHGVARTTITLPTDGVLTEAVLGSCTACEKIDIRRFWNWQDAPIPTADDPGSQIGENTRLQSLVGPAGAVAPTGLTQNLPTTLIGNITTTGEGAVPPPSSALLGQLLAAPEPKIAADVTGRKELEGLVVKTADAASKARDEAVDAATKLATKVVGAVPGILETKKAVREKKIADLADNAKTLAAFVGKSIDEEYTAERAAGLVSDEVKAKELGPADRAKLLEALSPKNDDSEEVQRGKAALLQALGLGDDD